MGVSVLLVYTTQLCCYTKPAEREHQAAPTIRTRLVVAPHASAATRSSASSTDQPVVTVARLFHAQTNQPTRLPARPINKRRRSFGTFC